MANRNTKKKVFISYAGEDQLRAESLRRYLLQTFGNQIEVFFSKDILPGRTWYEEIKKQLAGVSVVVVIATPDSVKKPWINFEAGYGLSQGGEIVPICMDKLKAKEISEPFSSSQAIELSQIDPNIDIGKELKKLFKSIKKRISFKKKIGDIPWNEYAETICRANTDEFIGRIDRATRLVEAINVAIKEANKGIHVSVLMRSVWTSISNISHYYGRDTGKISPEDAKMLDDLHVQERELMKRLLHCRTVDLKCICWPKLKYLSDFYNDTQRRMRVELLRRFINDINNRNEHSRLQIRCDESAKDRNRIILGKRFMIVGKSRSGGYTESYYTKDTEEIGRSTEYFKEVFNELPVDKDNEKLLAMLSRASEEIDDRS